MLKDLFNKLRVACQVRRYIKRQYWFGPYKRLVSNKSFVEYLSFIYGFHGIKSISDAFSWSYTIQGYDYWKKVDERFKDWYYYGEE